MRSVAAVRSPVPAYLGTKWMDGTLPLFYEGWPKFSRAEVSLLAGDSYDIAAEEVRGYAHGRPWIWPQETIFFLCDIHADTDGFLRSLVASGGVALTGPGDLDFELTPSGREGSFIIGGDCLDKGPENLRLLRALAGLRTKGAKVEILAGNHDVRALVGLVYAGRKEPRVAHLWARMGKKIIPFLLEVHRQYVEPNPGQYDVPTDDDAREELFPDESWFRDFAAAAGDLVSPSKLERELKRIREKIVEMSAAAEEAGISLGRLHAATVAARRLFIDGDGEFAWFFRDMALARRAGSFLFIHAGVDDQVAELVRDRGVAGLNARFRELMESDLFELYHGPIGNTFRTKYRDTDLPFGPEGVANMHKAGIYALVHGHRNLLRGQRVSVYNGMLNFECDASIDRNTRNLEGLRGPGAAALIVRPEGQIVGVSTDYRYAKVFDASTHLGWTTCVSPSPGPGERTHTTQTVVEAEMGNIEDRIEDDRVDADTDATGTEAEPEKAEIRFEAPMSLAEATSYFESIVAGLRAGHMRVSHEGTTLTLEPSETVEIAVKAARKKGKEKISFDVEWRLAPKSELQIEAD